jgi:hypothetical protein
MTIFSIDHFEKFCSHLLIDSKEKGQIPLKWLGGQRYFVNEVAAGLNSGIHTFVCLKGRQLGISTVMLALDLYWMFLHKGLQGVVMTDTDSNKTLFRSYLSQYLKGLPQRAKVGIVEHNREQLILANRSRLGYIAAGKRKNESLGAGKSANFMHATECASWGDQAGIASLMATLAQQNPNRLYVYESTAYGYNAWYEIWQRAKDEPTTKAIFIGWWRHEIYQKDKNSPEYRTYWDGQPNAEEAEWIREVYELYGHNITDTQIAWWRWYLETQSQGDANLMFQAFPPTENYAFQMSGSKFFSSERVNRMYRQTLDSQPTFHRYKFGMHFEQTQFVDSNQNNAEVAIYEQPVPEGVYVLGADPAYGSSEWADEFCIQVCRCFSDKIVQVAEIATTEWNEAQFAWALAHLAGTYRPCMVVLEMQGPGGAVFNELQNLKRYAGAPGNEAKGIYNVVGGIRDYLWRKQDSLMGTYAYQWQTTSKEKLRMMSQLRNYFEREMIVVNSPDTANQFRNIRREGDSIGGEGRAKDDRVIALGLAVIGWNDTLMPELQMQQRTYEREMRPKDTPKLTTPLENAVTRFFRAQGIRPPQ